MWAVVPGLLLFAVVPRVEDPWPDTVGLWLPFSTWGVGMALAGVVFNRATQERREDAIRWGGFWGFVVGVLLYVLALLVQVISSL